MNLKGLIRPVIISVVSISVCLLFFYIIETVKKQFILPDVFFGMVLTLGYGIFIMVSSLITIKFRFLNHMYGYIVNGIFGFLCFFVWVALLIFGSGLTLISYFLAVKFSILFAWAIGSVVGFMFSYHLQRRSILTSPENLEKIE